MITMYLILAMVSVLLLNLLTLCLLAKPFDQQPVNAMRPVLTRLDKLAHISFFTVCILMTILIFLSPFLN